MVNSVTIVKKFVKFVKTAELDFMKSEKAVTYITNQKQMPVNYKTFSNNSIDVYQYENRKNLICIQ
jgi:hypothetical protein